jgi:GNAT superfamily N-acetyltransferase
MRPYRDSDRDRLVALWSDCGLLRPWNSPHRDIERKLAHDADGLLVLQLGDRLVGSVMVGYDGHRGWVNYLAVDPEHQGAGLGRLLMDEVERHLSGLGRRRDVGRLRRARHWRSDLRDGHSYRWTTSTRSGYRDGSSAEPLCRPPTTMRFRS